MKPLNNEQIGISAEIAIADFFSIPVSEKYRSRGVPAVVDSIKPIVSKIFSNNNIPNPIGHIAERQNPVDFKLDDNKCLSVKTNKQQLGKAAPQKIGQASSNTWFSLLAKQLNITNSQTNYKEKVNTFKTIALAKIDKLLSIYWNNIFDCDFLIQIFNVVNNDDSLTNNPKFIVFKKTKSPIWNLSKITFTKSKVTEWNESNTVKYDGVSIGEFQVHNNRDNFKFRFNMANIEKLINDNKLKFS